MPTSLPEVSDTIDYDLFLNHSSGTLSGASESAYRRDREAYLAFCQREGFSKGDTDYLESYKAFLLSKSAKANTLNRKLCGIKKGLIAYIVATKGKDKEEFARNLYKSIHLIKIGAGEKVVRPEDILTEGDIQALIESADKKLAFMIKFLSMTGCRISEMLNVKLSDIRGGTGGVMEVSVLGKGNKMRTVLLSTPDIDLMKETFGGQIFLFETIHGNRYSRTNIAKTLGELSELVLGRHVNAHLFRHSFGTNMIKNTRKIQATSEYLGHSNVAITLSMYTHESLSLDELGIS